MNTKNAVVNRIIQLCSEKEITVNELAYRSGIPSSTTYSLLNSQRKSLGIVTIKKLCDGFQITLGEFFNTEEFRELEQEIK